MHARCSLARAPAEPAISVNLAISFSCSELNWSEPAGMVLAASASSSHSHWNTEASNRAVGVSALYSSSRAAPFPS
jgi:hypothetical protein